MDQKNWKQSALYYGLVILLLLAGLVFLANRSGPPARTENQSSSLRIVSLAPNLTEILFALGLDVEIAAVSSDSNYPPQFEPKKKVGSFWNPDLEAVLSVEPTLVFTLGFQQQTNLAVQLEAIGCQTISLTIESIDQLYEAIETIGGLTDRQEAASRLIEEIAHRLEGIRQTAAASEPVRVLWVVQRQPVRAAGKNTFINELLEIAGAVNVIETTIYQYPPVDEEQIIASAPDVIIETADNAKDLQRLRATVEEFYRRFEGIPAVKNHRVFVINGDLVCRLGPRLPLGVEVVRECIQQARSDEGKVHADF